MSASISVQYAARVAAGKIERDSAQEAVIAALARLETRIAEHRLARKSSSLGWLFGTRARESEHIKGLYVYGEVGRGKTMLMDSFFAASPVARGRALRRSSLRLRICNTAIWAFESIPPVAAVVFADG